MTSLRYVTFSCGALLISAIFFQSCVSRQKTDELQEQLDSLSVAYQAQTEELEIMSNGLSVITEAIDSIQISENIIVFGDSESWNKSGIGRNIDNLNALNEMIQRQKKQISLLEEKLAQADTLAANVIKLRALVEHLNNELVQKEEEIKYLKAELLYSNRKVKELTTKVEDYAAQNAKLDSTISIQTDALTAQDKEINEVYYLIDTKRHLQKIGVMSIVSKKVKYSKIPQYLLTAVDCRNKTEFEIESGHVEIVSDMPQGSYIIEKVSNTKSIVHITDAVSFWSLTKYLIIAI